MSCPPGLMAPVGVAAKVVTSRASRVLSNGPPPAEASDVSASTIAPPNPASTASANRQLWSEARRMRSISLERCPASRRYTRRRRKSRWEPMARQNPDAPSGITRPERRCAWTSSREEASESAVPNVMAASDEDHPVCVWGTCACGWKAIMGRCVAASCRSSFTPTPSSPPSALVAIGCSRL